MYKEKKISLRLSHDSQVDASYLYFENIRDGEVHKSESILLPNGSLNIDFSKEGKILGIEILGADDLLPENLLNQVIK